MSAKLVRCKGGVCAAKGFLASAVSCGIKDPTNDRLDLALIYSEEPSVGAAVYTQNEVRAAPVKLSAQYIKRSEPRAILVNSGNANACNGPKGGEDARSMVTEMSKALKIRQMEMQLCSTGIIGMPMPMERLEGKYDELVSNLKRNSDLAAQAIMTSDTRPKSCAVEGITEQGEKFKVGGIAKGAGMINPQMATMLCFVTTDIAVTKAELSAATQEAVDYSFNRISVDGDMSTNDTVIVLANGAAGNKTITKGGEGSAAFREGLKTVMLDLAKKIVSDGERVTKLVEVCVKGAASNLDAERIARTVANSNLVKCSWNGNDPNWGRVLHAVGYSGARVREEYVDIYFDGVIAAQHGVTAKTPISRLVSVVKKKEFTVGIDLNIGKGEFKMYTSDLSPEYVEFNREEYAATKLNG